MKNLLALSLLLASSAALSQTAPAAREYALSDHIFWNYDVPIVLNYSSLDAPASAPLSLVIKVLGDVEARINGLNISGLSVRIGRTDLASICESRTPSEVLVCWENRTGETSNFQTYNRTDDLNYWHEAHIVMGKNTVWTETMLYEWLLHHVLHIIGFAHPEGTGTSALNGATDLTQLDIDGLRLKYRADRCAVTYSDNGQIVLPFVRYMGGAYTGTLQHDGASSFTLVAGTLGQYGSQGYNIPAADPLRVPVPAPATPCAALEIDGNNELFVPEVRVGSQMYQGTLVFGTDGRFTLKNSAVK